MLRGLDEAIASMHTGVLATAAVARFEGLSGTGAATRMRWASAGHPPPFVLAPDREVRILGGRFGDLMLGVDATTVRAEWTVEVLPDSVVLLYTDGLIERRGSTIDAGLERLRACLAELSGRPLAELCDEVLDHMLEGTPQDDVALVALAVRPAEQPR